MTNLASALAAAWTQLWQVTILVLVVGASAHLTEWPSPPLECRQRRTAESNDVVYLRYLRAPRRGEGTMTADDFRRIALSFDGAEESSHMGVSDFRVGGHIFATLASQDKGFGNLKLTSELQQLLIAESPSIFLPIKGGWGRMGMTHIRLAETSERQMTDALHSAWRLRVEMNEKGSSRSKKPVTKKATTKAKRG